MGATIKIERIFETEPYRSIVNLLAEHKDGLELKHIQYAIMEDPCLMDYTIRKIEEDLGPNFPDILRNGKIKKYHMKQINRIEKRSQKQTDIPKSKCVRNNLNNFLNKLMLPPNKIIYRENGKYKLHSTGLGKLLAESDKDYIDSSSKVSIKNIEGGRINIYGYLPIKGISFDPGGEEQTKKFKEAETKLIEGVDALQSLMNESLSWYMDYDLYSSLLLNKKKYSPLDRGLLLILRGLFLTGNADLMLEWFEVDQKTCRIKILNPDRKLIDLLKKVDSSQKISELKSLLNGHVINQDISMAFLYFKDILVPLYSRSHIVVVLHSGGGHFADEKAKQNELQKIPMFFNEKDKQFTDLSTSHKNSIERYLVDQRKNQDALIKKVEEQKILDPKKIKQIEKMIKAKEIKSIEDWISFQKKLINI